MKKFLAILFVLAMAVQASLLAAAADSRPKLNAESIAAAPKIDGVITEAEWGKPVVVFTPTSADVVVNMESVNQADINTAKKALPSEVKLYIRWNADNLYIGAQVTDETYYNPFINDSSWMGDSFECDIGVNLKDQRVRFRNNIALSTSDEETYALVYHKPNSSMDDIVGTKEEVTGECKVARSGKITTYELAFAWSTYSKDGSVKTGYQFYLNPQFHIANGVLKGKEKDYEYYLGYMRYAEKSGENDLYPIITLTGSASVATTSSTTAIASEATTGVPVETTSPVSNITGAASSTTGSKDQTAGAENNGSTGIPAYAFVIIVGLGAAAVGAGAGFGGYLLVKKRQKK